jgi:hypothetical protein
MHIQAIKKEQCPEGIKGSNHGRSDLFIFYNLVLHFKSEPIFQTSCVFIYNPQKNSTPRIHSKLIY